MSPNAPAPLLKITGLRASFKGRNVHNTILHGIDLQVHKNEVLAIVGESGSGKSVTALSIPKLFDPKVLSYDQGEIIFHSPKKGRLNLLVENEKSLAALRGAEIGVIFQEPMTSLNPVYTCGEQIMEVLQKHRTLSLQEAKIKTLSLFEQVKLQDPLTVFSKYPHQLSGGQKQRVMIAMGISCDPELLICDEPTTALDATVQKNILELLKEIQKTKGLGILFITHDLGVVASFAHRVVVMKNGRIVETGKTEQVLKNPTHDYTKGLLNCRPGLYKKGERLPDLSSTPTQPKENIPISANVNIWKTTPSNWLIQAKDVCIGYHQKSSWRKKSQKSLWTLNKVSFDIFEGETIGLVGESGSGKSTIGKALAGLLPINQGSLAYRGNTNAWNIPAERKKLSRLIQFVFQDPYSSLNPKMTVEETLMEPLTVHSIYNSAFERKKRVQFLLEKVGLGSSALNRFPHEFSGGQRQRIVIARALTMQPQLLICDESVSALDVSVQAQVLNLLNDLKSEFGLTLLFISHDLAVIRYMSDRIMVLNKGKLEEMGPAEDICAHPSSLYTKQLLDAMPVL